MPCRTPPPLPKTDSQESPRKDAKITKRTGVSSPFNTDFSGVNSLLRSSHDGRKWLITMVYIVVPQLGLVYTYKLGLGFHP